MWEVCHVGGVVPDTGCLERTVVRCATTGAICRQMRTAGQPQWPSDRRSFSLCDSGELSGSSAQWPWS